MEARRILVTAVSAGLLLAAQNPNTDLFNQAPPDIDKALRERIGKFYQAFVDGKFRVADEVVCEVSKDLFFAMEKRKHLDYEILRINYKDDFRTASASVGLGSEVAARGKIFRVKVPMASRWKIENGRWCWYNDPNEGVETPFGTMKPGPGSPAPANVTIPNIDEAAAAILGSVKVNKREVTLHSFKAATDEVLVANGMPGNISLKLGYEEMKGFSASLDTPELKSGEKAKISFRYDPPDKTEKSGITVSVRIEPTLQVIPLTVTFAVTP